MRERTHYLHNTSIPTEDAYVHWIRAFVFFHGRRHPGEMGGPEVDAFLSWLANERNVAVSTHRQALSALMFLYQKVPGPGLPWMEAIGRPRREPRLPVVLSFDEGAKRAGFNFLSLSDMARRWAAVGFLEAEKRFRRIQGHRVDSWGDAQSPGEPRQRWGRVRLSNPRWPEPGQTGKMCLFPNRGWALRSIAREIVP